MIRYIYNTQKVPPAPFVRVTLIHPVSGDEIRDVPAQLDTGADCSLVPYELIRTLKLNRMAEYLIAGVGDKEAVMGSYSVLLGIHNLPPRELEVLSHPDEPWILLGRDVLNGHRLLLDGPDLALEID